MHSIDMLYEIGGGKNDPLNRSFSTAEFSLKIEYRTRHFGCLRSFHRKRTETAGMACFCFARKQRGAQR